MAYANLARNQDVDFRLGWHVLRNRDYETRNTSVEARDAVEEQFFSRGLWKDFRRNLVGIASLRARLSQVLLQQIRNELPSLLQEIEVNVKEIRMVLDKLGPNRATNDEQRLFLLHISQSFQSIVNAAVDGTYGDSFFGNPRSVEGYSKRLRAVVQNLNMEFAEIMRTRGHRRHIVDQAHSTTPLSMGSETSPRFPEPLIISRAKFVDEVTELLKRSRGRELPGMFNPLIIGDLFHEQSAPWGQLMRLHLKAVLDATRVFLELVTTHLTDEVTADALLREVIDPLMERRYGDMTAKLVELLIPHQKEHPITYNHYFTETIQNMREHRLEAEVTRRLSTFFGYRDLRTLEELPIKMVKTSSLISALTSRNEADMDRYASSELLDCMRAYYKVTMKSIIDNIATQAVETLLVGKLGDLLSPACIMKMKPDLVSKIAAESSDNQSQREQLTRKLVVLQAGLETCKKYVGRPTTHLQHRPWHTDVHVSSEDEIDDGIHDNSLEMEQTDVQEVIEAHVGTTTGSELFEFSGAEAINPFALEGWGNSEQKMECADSEEPVFRKSSKKKKGAKQSSVRS